MTRFLISRFFLIAAAVQATAGVCFAQTPTTQATWPQKVVVNVGEIRTRIDGPKMWTLSGVDFQNTMLATEDSAYGTVFTIRNVGHLGTAHFLDVPGKPGEVEKENVKTLKMFIDDKEVEPLKPAMDLIGSSFRMERTSTIREVDLVSLVSLRDGVIIESAKMKVNAPFDLQKAHPTMYAFTPEATVYVVGDDKGIIKRGIFAVEGKGGASVEATPSWIAVFSPATGKGGVFVIRQKPDDAEGGFLIVDAPGVYRKAALYTLIDRVLPAGYEGTWETAVGFFNATEAEWEAVATTRAAELKAFDAKRP